MPYVESSITAEESSSNSNYQTISAPPDTQPPPPTIMRRFKLRTDIPVRYLILALVLVSTAVEYVCRYNINVSMVAMAKALNHTETGNTCPVDPNDMTNGTKTPVHEGVYDWDAKTQGIILGAFFYSYTAMQVPSGRIAEEFGGRWVVSISLIGSGILNLATPALTFSVFTLTASRVILGFLQAGLFPSCFSIIFNWFPQQERSMAYAVMEVGTMIGSISAAALAGYLADHGFAGGWPSTFYVSGITAILAAVLWTPYVTSIPEEHHWISVDEVKRIRTDSTNTSGGVKPKRRKRAVPWKAILTSRPVVAVVLSKFLLRWTFYTLVMKLPTYLNDVLHMSATQNGIVNASMYLISMVPLLAFGYVSELLISKGWLTRTNCRKTFVTIACLGSAVCVALVPIAGCNVKLVTTLLLVGNIFLSFDSGGNIPTTGEVSKNFATTIFALVNMLNTSAGFIVPYVIGWILESGAKDDHQDLLKLWSVVFYMAAGIAVLGAIIFVTFGSAERQPWDFDQLEGDEEDNLVSNDEEDNVTDALLVQQYSPVRRLTTN